MLKVQLKLLFLLLTISQTYSQLNNEKILFVGHAYGSHSLNDKALDPIFVDFSSKYGSKYNQIILGGDFIYDCKDDIEFNNFLEFYNLNQPNLVIGGHDNCNRILSLIDNKETANYYEKKEENLLLYLNTSLNSYEKVDMLYNYVVKTINSQKPKNILIFTHQLIFSESDWYVRVNSRGYYKYANKFYNKLYKNYYKTKDNFYFIAGDIGAFQYTPYAFSDVDENFRLIATGLGNNYHYKGIEIELSNEVKINFVDLKSAITEPLNKYSKLKVQIYQFPKLILSRLKKFIFPSY